MSVHHYECVALYVSIASVNPNLKMGTLVFCSRKSYVKLLFMVCFFSVVTKFSGNVLYIKVYCKQFSVNKLFVLVEQLRFCLLD